MKFIGFVLFASLFPSLCFGAPFVVRSGEHDDFTRVVIDVSREISWNLDKEGLEVNLRLTSDGEEAGFNLDAVYDRIGRSRIEEVREISASELKIYLNCECLVSDYIFNSNMLVLDIFNPAPRDSIEDNVAKFRSLVTAFYQLRKSPASTVTIANGNFRIPKTRIYNPKIAFKHKEPSPASGSSRVSEKIWHDPMIKFRRSALEGARHNLAKHRYLGSPAAGGTHIKDMVAVEQINFDYEEIGPKAASQNPEVKTCVEDSELISHGRALDQIYEEVISRPKSLFSEIDDLNIEGAIHTVKALLQMGFGAEARSYIQAFPGSYTDVLLSLTFVADGEADESGILLNQVDCDGQISVWSFLAHNLANVDYSDPNIENIKLYYAMLPAWLQAHMKDEVGALGQNAIKKKNDLFASAGREDNGELNGANRKLYTSKAVFQTSGAAGRGEMQGARKSEQFLGQRYGKPAFSNNDINNSSFSIERAEDEGLEALLVRLNEVENTNQFPRLWEKSIEAFLSRREFLAAADLFVGFQRKLEEKLVDKVRGKILDELLSKGTAIQNLKIFISDEQAELRPSDLARSRAVVDKLLELGFPSYALLYLKDLGETLTEEDKLRGARAYLEMDDYMSAEKSLLGMSSRQAKLLRAKTREGIGDHWTSSRILTDLANYDEASRMDWLAGNWETLAKLDSAHANAAKMVIESQEHGAKHEYTQSELRNLVDESASSRDIIGRLLSEASVD